MADGPRKPRPKRAGSKPKPTRGARARARADADLTDKSRGERLQRVLADAGVASRRACETMIEEGRVEVNGDIVTALPVWVDPAVDHIVVDGRPIDREPDRHVYILLNKPARTLSTVRDEPGADRRTVVELVDHPSASRLFPVGRLDYDSIGLVLLTNDGELANRLTHPRYGVPKTYKVKVAGVVADEDLAELERGVYLADRKAGKTVGATRTSRVELAVIRRERDATWLEITLREGRNRQVRRMLAAVGCPVLKLERTAMGPLQLRGVARGAWRELKAPELRALRRAAADERGPARTGGSEAGGRVTTKPKPRKKAPGSTKKVTDRGGSTRRSSPQEAEAPVPKAVRRRNVKNAINRAARDGRSR